MKKMYLLVAALLTFSVLITGCSLIPTASTEKPIRTMDVSGSGIIELTPDIARVNIGVRSQSPNAADALEENNASAEGIIKSLMAIGIEQQDIQTRNFNIYPQQNREPGPDGEIEERQIFVVENTVSVTVRNLDSLGEVLAAVVEEGANTIHGVTFDVQDRESALEESRKLAIDDAKAQAQAIAETAGVSLGPIRTISINENGGIVPVPRAVEMEMPQGGSVPISTGQLTIRVTADLTYEIE